MRKRCQRTQIIGPDEVTQRLHRADDRCLEARESFKSYKGVSESGQDVTKHTAPLEIVGGLCKKTDNAH